MADGQDSVHDMGIKVLEALGDRGCAIAVSYAFLLGRLAGTADALSEALVGDAADPEARDALLGAAWENIGLLEEIEEAVRAHA
ncbi:MAG: hypothetical protein MR415_06570 [Coriobacteriaceae bacterium]|nr:hypothetical protein [Coriobacteriaceae bacterium]MDD7583925.1 hypothetical protein [Coriobacteriaceae bacterium]